MCGVCVLGVGTTREGLDEAMAWLATTLGSKTPSLELQARRQKQRSLQAWQPVPCITLINLCSRDIHSYDNPDNDPDNNYPENPDNSDTC